MRRKSKKTAGVFLLAVILTFVFILTFSADAAEKKGSITVELNELETDRAGIMLECFCVAEEGENGWHLTETFDGSGIKPWKLEKAVDYKKAAERLSSWANTRNLSAETETTDKNGKLVFSDLKEGIYLIRQKSGIRTYGTIAPFIVCIPMEENGMLLYDVQTKTKGEEILEFTATPTVSVTTSASVMPSGSSGSHVSVKSGSSNVKTGDDTALAVFWVLLILAAGGTVGILYYRKKH